jgi:hypothetical protein
MSAKPSKSKFEGLFKQAAETPIPDDPIGRVEREDAVVEPAEPAAIQPEPTRQDNPIPERTRTGQARGGGYSAPVILMRPPGRPPGKRSDPAWKQFSVLLRRETQRKAVDMLRDADDGRDLSGLVQSLLDGWIKKQNK